MAPLHLRFSPISRSRSAIPCSSSAIPLVDVLVIAILFTLRIVAGMTLVGPPPSEWLLMFSIFFFFSLALMKREVELGVMEQVGAKTSGPRLRD